MFLRFTNKQAINGEMAVRGLSSAAREAYNELDACKVYELDTDEGKRYSIRGIDDEDGLTFKQLEQYFLDYAEVFDAFDEEV